MFRAAVFCQNGRPPYNRTSAYSSGRRSNLRATKNGSAPITDRLCSNFILHKANIRPAPKILSVQSEHKTLVSL